MTQAGAAVRGWRRVPGLSGALVALLLPGPAHAVDAVQVPQDRVTAETLPEGAAPAPGMPDERPLWRLLAAGDDATLQGRIARLQTAYPAWRPPARLTALLDRRTDEAAVAAAKAGRDWATVRRLAATHPDMRSCARPDDAAIAAAAPGAASTLALVYAGCTTDAARAALLGAVLDRFGAGAAAPVLAGRDEATLPQAVRTRLESARMDEAFQRLGRALATGAPDVAAQGAVLRPAIEARRDGGSAAALGWAALKAGQPQAALSWFELARRLDPAQPVAGLARAHAALGETDAARRVLSAAPGPDTAALSAEIERAQIDAAFRRGAYLVVVADTAGTPDPPILLGWSLFRLNRFDDAAQAFERRYRRHRERAAADGLVMSLVKAGRPEAAEAAAARFGGPVRVALQATAGSGGTDPGYRRATAPLRAALARHDDATAGALGPALAPAILAHGEHGLLTALGWAAFAREDFAAASRWFALGAGSPVPAARDDAEYGLALARFRQGDAAAAEAAAAAHPPAGRWAALRLDALMRRANRLNEARQDDPAALDDAGTALRLDPGRRDAAMLLAWSDLRAGRSMAAAATFERLYRAQPDEAAASGLVNAPAPPETLLALVQMPGPLAGVMRVRSAQDAFGRKAFLAATRIDPGASPALVNLDAPQFGLSATRRDKSGESGTSRLTSLAEDLTASLVHGTDRTTIRLHVLELDAGRAPPSLAGAGIGAGAVTRMTTRLTGVEPVVSWERQAVAAPLLSPFAELGLTPLNGVVGPTVQGQAGVAYQGGRFNLRGIAYRQPVTESILSFSGIHDPRTGRRIGRVTETGARMEAYAQLAPRWGVYAQTALGLREGVGVGPNRHAASAATLSYDLRVPGLDYLTLGPSSQFSAFQRDLSGFTPGQGGYYSPTWSYTAGAAMRMQTEEAQDVILRAAVFTGWQIARSAGAPNAAGVQAGPSRQDGFNSAGEVVAATRLSERWVAGGMVRYQVSPQFTDLYAGLALRFSLGDRAALLSADLPRFDVR